MKQIALIGAGNIGCRHLQALTRLDREAHFYVMDTSAAALERAKTHVNTARSEAGGTKLIGICFLNATRFILQIEYSSACLVPIF